MDPPPVFQSERIRNPFNGETFIFTNITESPEECCFDLYIESGGMLSGTGRQHLHPQADEEFSVVRGKLLLIVDGQRRLLEEGGSSNIPCGTPHYFRNGHDGETLLHVRFRPGQQFFRFFLNMALSTAKHPEWYDKRGEPPLVFRALVLHAYPDHAYAAGIPILFQKALFAALSPIGRARGYQLLVPPRSQ